MFRTTDILLIAAMVSAAAFTYKVKHEAEEQLAAVRKIEQQIRFEEDSIDLLKADWSLLTQPSRLQKLAETYQSELQLEPVEARQVVELNEIPMRPVEDFSTDPVGAMAQSGTDKVVTGAVR
ncbi:hypothetical protein [Mesorhizobium sp. KR2-14]|uniref:cell division protein FtsL n=1 Tax=Mesorhizobium sp. KR2-14 TaxID=3156610 RepID=UPI0032B50763